MKITGGGCVGTLVAKKYSNMRNYKERWYKGPKRKQKKRYKVWWHMKN